MIQSEYRTTNSDILLPELPPLLPLVSLHTVEFGGHFRQQYPFLRDLSRSWSFLHQRLQNGFQLQGGSDDA